MHPLAPTAHPPPCRAVPRVTIDTAADHAPTLYAAAADDKCSEVPSKAVQSKRRIFSHQFGTASFQY